VSPPPIVCTRDNTTPWVIAAVGLALGEGDFSPSAFVDVCVIVLPSWMSVLFFAIPSSIITLTFHFVASHEVGC